MTRIHSLGYFKPKSGLPAQVYKCWKMDAQKEIISFYKLKCYNIKQSKFSYKNNYLLEIG